jgi:hypothetical protein
MKQNYVAHGKVNWRNKMNMIPYNEATSYMSSILCQNR